MNLFSQLAAQVEAAAAQPAPAPPAKPAAAPTPAMDNVIDIDQRDAMLAAIAAAPLDPTHGGELDRMLRQGANLATLNAATKIAYKLPTAELIRRYGKPAPELKAAADWNRDSINKKREP